MRSGFGGAVDRYYVLKLRARLLEPVLPGRLPLPERLSEEDELLIGRANRRDAPADGWRPADSLVWWPEDTALERSDRHEFGAAGMAILCALAHTEGEP